MAEVLYDVMIVGGGPAGAAAAGYAARASLKTLVLDKSLMSGALALARTVANYPGVEEEISGLELLERMRRQSQRFGAEFVQTQVLGADLRGDPKKLFADRTYAGKTVIIATGASERKRKVPGEAELLGKGVSYCATCDGAFFKDEVVAAVGDNDHALEEALFLTKHASRVHLVNPAREFKAPRELAAQVLGQAKVEVHAETQFRAVEGDGAVAAIRVHPRGGQEARLPVSGVFIFLQGNAPSTEFLQGTLEIRESGCLVVDHNRMTSIPGVFAVGDVTCDQLKQAVVAAAEGAIAAMSADRYLNKLARAAPGRYY